MKTACTRSTRVLSGSGFSGSGTTFTSPWQMGGSTLKQLSIFGTLPKGDMMVGETGKGIQTYPNYVLQFS